MISFCEPLAEYVWYKRRRYTLKPWFDHVLSAYRVLEDDRFTRHEQIDIALSYLIDGKYPIDGALLSAVFDALKVLPNKRSEDAEAVIDFEYDAPYIYAAFMQTYGIDLFEQKERLHWQKFVAMFASLPSDTRFEEIIGIRTRKVPRISKNNREEVEKLMRAKAYYKLPAKNPDKNFENGLKKMIMALHKGD